MRAVIYSRVSTDAQERDGTSLDTQEDGSREYARRLGWTVIESIRDSASGFSLDRPGIERVRDALRKREVDVIVSYAVDRLSRNQNQIGVLFDEAQTAGVRLEFVTEKFEDTAIGRFILAARAFVAEVEREKIVERTTRGKAQRARDGRIPQGTGRGIYGFEYDRDSGTRHVHPLQAPIVLRMFEEFVAGVGISRIAKGLNDEAVPAFGGGHWHPLTIRRILLNETYTGRTVYRRTRVAYHRDPATGKKLRRVTERESADWIEVPDATPSIVATDLFLRAQEIFDAPERKQRGRPTEEYRLRGRLRCLTCGTPMTGQALGRGRWRYYRCRNSYTASLGGKCDERYVPRDLLEGSVVDEIARVLSNPVRLRDEVMRFFAATEPRVSALDTARALGRIKEQQKRLARLIVNGDFPEAVLQGESKRLQAELHRIESRSEDVAIAGQRPFDLPTVLEMLPLIADRLGAWLRKAGSDDLELVLRALDVKVKATRDRAMIEASVPLPESLQNLDLVTIEQTSA